MIEFYLVFPVLECGLVSELYDSKKTSLPWSGSLQKGNDKVCETVLINHDWVMLAAECVKNFEGYVNRDLDCACVYLFAG